MPRYRTVHRRYQHKQARHVGLQSTASFLLKDPGKAKPDTVELEGHHEINSAEEEAELRALPGWLTEGNQQSQVWQPMTLVSMVMQEVTAIGSVTLYRPHKRDTGYIVFAQHRKDRQPMYSMFTFNSRIRVTKCSDLSQAIIHYVYEVRHQKIKIAEQALGLDKEETMT